MERALLAPGMRYLFGSGMSFFWVAAGLGILPAGSGVLAIGSARAAQTGTETQCGLVQIENIKTYLEASNHSDKPSVSDDCGCAALAQGYPNYVIQVGNFDSLTGEYVPETITVQGATLYTNHFAVHYPVSSARTDAGETASYVETDCRWDWGVDEVKDFGSSNYYIDCSDEEASAYNAAVVLDSIWDREIGMGYPTPPVPAGRIDVYIGELSALVGSDVSGVTEACAESQGGGPSNSRMFLDSALNDPVAMEDTAAHAFFHVVQNGIDHKEGLAWMEYTAVWMQGMVTGRWDWGFETFALEHYDLPLTHQVPWPILFGNVVWPRFLSDHYGASIVKDIWLEADEALGDEGMLHAYERLNAGTDGYAAAIHHFRYGQWAEGGAPNTAEISLSRRSSEAEGGDQIWETTANFVLFTGDPKEADGKLKVCFENIDAKPGLWAKLAIPEQTVEADGTATEKYSGDLGEGSAFLAVQGKGDDPPIAGGAIKEVSLDQEDAACVGAYMEVDGFGTVVPWVALIVTFAGDPEAGDLCSGHGAYALCGHKDGDPPCGRAEYHYSVKVEYPEREPGGCSMTAGDAPSRTPLLSLLAFLLFPAICVRSSRRH